MIIMTIRNKFFSLKRSRFTKGVSTQVCIFLLLYIMVSGCKPDDGPNVPPPLAPFICAPQTNAGTPYELQVAEFFPQPVIPDYNPMTVEGVELGRHLFWETALSRNNTISCGSCHSPQTAFSDNVAQSVGLYGDLTPRNSMGLINLAWNNTFFWDGRAHSLEEQLLEPVAHPQEMDLSWPEAVERITADADYQGMFTGAFGTPCVDSLRISYAMAQFLRTMISDSSRFDRAYRYFQMPLTPSEIRGLQLFQMEAGDPEVFPGGQGGGDCFHCHGGGLVEFTDHQFHNNGIDSVLLDQGRAGVTGNVWDVGLFKTPTLRNIALTAPYMHDGRFATLHEVLEHYNSGGHASATLDPLMKMQGVGLELSPQDIDDLVNFLETLTDASFINNPAFSDPH